MPPSQPLPAKENGFFKKILKAYEDKEYKQGLRFAQKILGNPKFAEHGETLAMKGLILNCLARKEEAYDHVRRGLRNDLRSHVCWHVFGLLQRSDHKYDEAIKAYRNALRWDNDNMQILRDLSLLQIQMRDYNGFRETRQRLLELRPGMRASWIGYAISWHLLKDYSMALCVLNEFRNTLSPEPYDYEISELCLYQEMILEEAGRHSDALAFLAKHDEAIVDRLYMEETRARLHFLLGNKSEAAQIYRALLERNPERKLYYTELERCEPSESEDERLRLYASVLDTHPRASMPKKLPLSFLTGDNFRKHIDEFLRRSIRKGVPSLFVNVRSLYVEPKCVFVIQELVLSYHSCLEQYSKFSEKDDDEAKETPVALLWTNVFLSQHYSHLGEYSKALEYVDSAISDTPTLPELYMIRGRIYKKAGNVYEAYRSLDEAQSLDTADRYINCECAKFMLRNNLVSEAEQMCQKFTREGASAIDNLNEMQCMWFQTEAAEAYRRRNEWGNSLKLCHQVDRHFTEITEDQFDFHTYCLRKMTLRSYVAMLRLEDVLRSHKFYFKAAKTAIKIYLHLHSHPVEVKEDTQTGTENDDPTKSKSKKARELKKAGEEKRRQEEEKKKQEEEKKKQAAKQAAKGEPLREELNPVQLEQCKDPLAEAIKFLIPLQTLCSTEIESHVLAYQIYSRKEKPLLMLKAIKGGMKLASDDPEFHLCLMEFRKYVDEKRSHLPPDVQQVLENEMLNIYGEDTDVSTNNKFLAKHINSVRHRLAAANAMCLLDKSNKVAALELCTKVEEGMKPTAQSCEIVYNVLLAGELGNTEQTAEEYKTQCSAIFPYSCIFNPPVQPTKDLNGPESLEESCHEP